MLKRIISITLVLLFVLTAFTACESKKSATSSSTPGTTTSVPAASSETTEDKVVLRLSTQNPDTNITTRTMRFFSDLVSKKSNGNIQIDVYPNAQLGAENIVLEQILTGSLDIAPISAAVLCNVVSEVGVFSTPFLFKDMDIVQSICNDQEFRKELFDIIRKKTGGAETLGFTSSTARGVSNTKRPIRTAADLKGLKIRTIGSPIIIETFNLLGATATSIPYKEVYTALQQGLIDGEDSSVDGNITMKFIEVVKHYTELQYMFQNGIILVAPATWKKLNHEQKDILTQCAIEADKYGFAESKKFAPNAYEKAAKEYPDYQIVSDLTDEEYETFRSIAATLWDKYKGEIGEKFFDMTVELSKKYENKK